MNPRVWIFALLLMWGAAPVMAAGTPSAPGAKVYIIWPYNGARIEGGKMWVRFGLQGMGVAPAGVEKRYTGHHHLIVNAELPSLESPIPVTENYIHFGSGATEGRITLPSGRHTLQLLFADHNHIPHDPPLVSKKITITVP